MTEVLVMLVTEATWQCLAAQARIVEFVNDRVDLGNEKAEGTAP